MNLKKALFIFFILFFSNIAFGQKSKEQLDSLYLQLNVLRAEGKFKEAIVLCKELISGYESIKEDKASVKGYIFIANTYSNLYNTKESLRYLDIAAAKSENLNDDEIQIRINGEYGRCYHNLGFYTLALNHYKKAIHLAQKNKRKKDLEYLYGLRSVIYEHQKDYKNMYADLLKAHLASPTTYTSSRLAKYYISLDRNMDSARYYLEAGEKYSSSKTLPIFQKSVLDRNWGRYYLEKGDYKTAVSYLEKSISISEKLNKPQDIMETQKILAQAYKLMNEYKKASENFENYSAIHDSLSVEKQKIYDLPVKKIIREKDLKNQKSYTTLYVIVTITIVLFIIIYIYTLKKYNSKKRESSALLTIKEEENLQLQQKVNESFENIVQLAKSNSPEFFTRFQEVYPEVINELLKIDPKLRVSELTLCAYIYLGFNAKDIATYTFRTISTVRNRKHNLRTKLNIPTEETTELWFKNLGKRLY